MDMLSKKVRQLSESATLAMTQKARNMRKQGIDMISLSLGEPDFKTPAEIYESVIEAIRSEEHFAYPPVPGHDDVREAIAEKLTRENRLEASADNIVISTGAKQALANLILATVDPEDEVVLASPYWVSYPDMVTFAGARHVPAQATLEDGYILKPEALEKALSPRSKMFIFSSPCNPTGAVFSPKDLEALVEVLRRYPRVLVVSDEIYEHIYFSEKPHSIGAFDAIKDRTITVNGLSKSYAMTGWRIGYLHAPTPIAKACAKIQGQFTSGANSLSQRAILTALRAPLQVSEHMRETYKRRRDMMLELFKALPDVKTYRPGGAFYLFPGISAYFGRRYENQLIAHDQDLCMFLLEKAHVSTVGGSPFGEPRALRISFAASDAQLQEAFTRIQEALSLLK